MAYRFAFLIEQTLGHVTHGQNLEAEIARDAAIEAAWLCVPYRCDDRIARTPLIRGNWTLKLSLRARARLLQASRMRRFDAVFFHTQVIAHGSLDLMRSMPAIVSLDATPVSRAAVEAQSLPSPPHRAERLKRLWTASVFRRAAAVVAWSTWAAQSPSRDYGTDPAKVHVIPPGVDLDAWRPRPDRPAESRLPRLLFIGGDFERKGGPVLLEALKNDLGVTCELDLVSGGHDIKPRTGLRVHHGLKPNSLALRELVSSSDVFVLPTRKDFSPLAILEAMACAVPVIATRTGGIPEQVEDGVSGVLVPAGDAHALATAVRALLTDDNRRVQMGRAGRMRAEALFSARCNTGALTSLMKRLVDEHRATSAARATSGGAGLSAVAATRVLP